MKKYNKVKHPLNPVQAGRPSKKMADRLDSEDSVSEDQKSKNTEVMKLREQRKRKLIS
jgi:hypothetical protein